jgi:hypothetical protein
MGNHITEFNIYNQVFLNTRRHIILHTSYSNIMSNPYHNDQTQKGINTSTEFNPETNSPSNYPTLIYRPTHNS